MILGIVLFFLGFAAGFYTIAGKDKDTIEFLLHENEKLRRAGREP